MHSNGRHGESPRHKTPIEYWVETLRKTGTGKVIVSDVYSTSSCLIMVNHMSLYIPCFMYNTSKRNCSVRQMLL